MTTTNTLIPLEEVRNILKCFIKYEESLNETLDSLPTIDPIATIDAEIQKHEYLSAKYLQEYDAEKNGAINYKRFHDVEKGIVMALKDIKSRLSTNS